MNYISQIFLDQRDVLRIYLAQRKNASQAQAAVYLDIAKEKAAEANPSAAEANPSAADILIWDDFIKEDVNIYINNDIYVLYSLGYVYIIDFNGNYIKSAAAAAAATATATTHIYIYDIESFNKLWLNFHKLFAEFYVGDKVLISQDAYKTQYANLRLENNIWITVPMNGIAIYTNEKKLQIPKLYVTQNSYHI